jgi:hypothetical protein
VGDTKTNIALTTSEKTRSISVLDKNVGDALLKLDLTPPSETPTSQIERIIDTDRRRVQRWTRIAIALWVLAAVGAFVIFVIGGLTFPMIAKLIMDENKAKAKAAAAAVDAKPAKNEKAANASDGTLEEPVTPFQVLAKLMAVCMVLGTAAFMLLVFAGLATVLLLLRSRTATFRQINANLLQISEQLKRVPLGQTGPAGS